MPTSVKQLSIKTVFITLVLSLIMTILTPFTSFAAETTIEDITNNPVYRTLTDAQKQDFADISQGLNLSYTDQADLLNQYAANRPSTGRFQLQWKTTLIKAAAKLLAAKLGEKSIADFTDFLFGWEGSLQNGIQYYLIHYAHWNSTAAYWTAKSIVFILF